MSPERMSPERMSPERWRRVKRLFDEAADLPPAAQAAFLDAA